ncbi:MAG: lipoyl(octanoyl) transferase [Crocinitomicaceae bacterium]|jgi:lipoyl(octanoyl) transferase|nr:lipoyl(octanoyl) transferase [Crocinitomicaceae bacterium]|tara:strand:+ start:117 stop:854 length:738 start_codon:yes stop_codon:yes gene_type:complete
MKPRVHFLSLGRASYAPVWKQQENLMQSIVQRKIARKKAGLSERERSEDPELDLPMSHLLFVEHPHVLTLGKSGDPENVVVTPARLKELGVEYFPINRGGDITYHGPGQLVGYPILDLDQFYTDIGKFMRMLEEAIILTCADYGVEAGRIEGLTGVWIDADQGMSARKIAALGVKCSRWVTMHGFAFNVNTDLDFFNLIVPCGIDDRGVTSLAKECGKEINEKEVSDRLIGHLGVLFDWNLISVD